MVLLHKLKGSIAMDLLEKWMQNNEAEEPDLDKLLKAADLTRNLIQAENYKGINRIIIFTIENNYFECFSWIMDLLQEEFEKNTASGLDDFCCDIGRSIENFDEFTSSLQIDFNVQKHDVEKVYDEHGEVESFFNVVTYNTKYKNINLISSENFDLKDNDYVQYKLQFFRYKD